MTDLRTASGSPRVVGSLQGHETGGRPLRIALNATAAITGGGVTYWLNLLPALALMRTSHEFLILASTTQRKINLDLPGNFRFVRVRFPRPEILSRVLWEQTRLPLLLRKERIDVLLAANDLAPLLAPCPIILAVRNPNPYWGPQGSTRKGRLRERVVRLLTRLASRKASHVFFVSEDSRQRISPALGLSPEKTSVVYHGIGPDFINEREPGPRVDPRLPAGPYILSVSAVRNHKDYGTLLRAFAGFRGVSPAHRDYHLVIAGAFIDPPYYDGLRALVAELGIQDVVEFRGEVPYPELPPLYRGAQMFVFPSLAETFGHPYVEAMASGVPCITSDLDVAREICGDAVEYFAPGDPGQLLSRMTDMAASPELRRARIIAGRERARQFSWSRCARETLALLEAAARRTSGAPRA